MPITTTNEAIDCATEHLKDLTGHVFDLLTIAQPISADAAVNLSKVVSKLSPILGNLIEFNVVEFLNEQEEFQAAGKWRRQDPGFPDAVFDGISPTPGFEIKAWFPLSTEITARFKDSQNHFKNDNTHVCMLAWLPEHIVYGRPRILDVVVVSGKSVAESRDNHYHNPPDYLVLEPENTVARTRNLQQTNTNGHKLQTTDAGALAEATAIVQSWGPGGHVYEPTPEYQRNLRELLNRFNYRLDTNYAKMDRIVHSELKAFKSRVGQTVVHGLPVAAWERLFRASNRCVARITKWKKAQAKAEEAGDLAAAVIAQTKAEAASVKLTEADDTVRRVLKERLNITEGDVEELLV